MEILFYEKNNYTQDELIKIFCIEHALVLRNHLYN